MDVLYNDFVSAFNLEKPGTKPSDTDQYVKEYFDTISKKTNSTEMGKA